MKNIKEQKKPWERLYIAYGSNLNLKQMRHRCPTAEVIGKTYLRNYRLMFYSVATVEHEKGSKVPVLVWKLQPRDEKALDIYEGYPNLYRKETLRITVNGERVYAMIYIMNESHHIYRIPSDHYFATIMEGYKEADFDPEYLYQAVRASQNAAQEGGTTYDRNH